MTKDEVMKELASYGDQNTKKVLMKHGAKEPFYGVKVQDLKKILKKTKKNYELSLELYATGNSDAMYLAGLMADETKMTKADLNRWVKAAYWSYLSEYTVPWVASESKYAIELGLKWMENKKEEIAAAGWSTIASYIALNEDENLDHEMIDGLLDRVKNNIHEAQNRVRYVMNGFVIAVGCYYPPLTNKAKELGETIGKVHVDAGGTACKVPFSPDYIQKVVDKGRLGKKRKSARC
ncbi:MAG: DNA alkylation repair protein [Bacteroidia bacterium]|nr:DNA alkylation repair protein [Bacteroidia bacterium]